MNWLFEKARKREMRIIEKTDHVENIQKGYIIKSKYANNHNTCKWTKLTNWKAEIFILENLKKKNPTTWHLKRTWVKYEDTETLKFKMMEKNYKINIKSLRKCESPFAKDQIVCDNKKHHWG